jgi:small subunit ribosomal protein S4
MLKSNRCVTPKCILEKRKKPQGGRRRRVSDRGLQLMEKQKARMTYGILERQFRHTYDVALKQPGITGENLQVMLERRLDNVVFRLGFADSRPQARQIVLHGHRTNIPSALISEGDSIGWSAHGAKTKYYKTLVEAIESKVIPTWLTLNKESMTGQVISLPTPEEIGAKYDGKAIVEYYSK